MAQQAPNDYLAKVYELAGLGASGLGPELPPVESAKWEGKLMAPLDIILNRPSLALSEAIGALAYDEDPWQAALRGAKGYRRYPSLGEQVFPEAAEPGFQLEDIGAYGIDLLGDPTNWIPFGAAKAALRPLGRGFAKIGKWVAPEVKAVLAQIPELELRLLPKEKVTLLKADLEALGFAGPADAAQHVLNAFPETRGVFPDDLTKELRNWDERGVDYLRAYMRRLDANFRPDIQHSLQSNVQEFARRLLPVGFVLKNFSHSGRQIAKRVQAAQVRARLATQRLVQSLELDKVVKLSAKDKANIVYTIEGVPARGLSNEVVDNAARIQRVLQEHGQVVSEFRDDFGEGITVFNPFTNDWEPFAEHFNPWYFPHRYEPDKLTKSSLNAWKDKMRAEGLSDVQIDRVIRGMGTKPRRVGNLEMMRIGGGDYIKDPAAVLPKYFSDSMTRLELAREFGTDNRLLNDLLGNLEREGFDKAWARNLGDMIVGRNIYERSMLEGVAPYLTSLQAISKLGFATSVANTSQAPLNQYIMSGKFIESLVKSGLPLPGGRILGGDPHSAFIGAAAFNRALRDDIVRLGMGSRSRISDFYMKAIGFNWSERSGRHWGATMGELDASSLFEAWRLNRDTNPKKAARMLGELERRYRVRLDQPFDDYLTTYERTRGGTAGGVTVGDMAAQLGRLPERVLEHAGIIGADTTMHAFNVMDLPLAWRSPNIKLLMQFKSYMYKQMGFLYSQVMAPGLQYLATDGAQGTIAPMLRAAVAMPVGAELVAHLRDVAKSLPSHVWSLATEGKPYEWDYRDPFWSDPEPGVKLFMDLTYIGSFGILGDIIEAANRGRLLRYAAGPTVTDLVDYLEALTGDMDIGKQLTRQLPGVLGLPYSANIFD